MKASNMKNKYRIIATVLTLAFLVGFGQYAVRKHLYYRAVEPNIDAEITGFYYSFGSVENNISSYIENNKGEKERTLDFLTKNIVRCQVYLNRVSSSVYTIGAAEKKYGFSQGWNRYLNSESSLDECFRIFLAFLDRCRNRTMTSEENTQFESYLEDALEIFREWDAHFVQYDFSKCETSKEYASMYRDMMEKGETLFLDRFDSFLGYLN